MLPIKAYFLNFLINVYRSLKSRTHKTWLHFQYFVCRYQNFIPDPLIAEVMGVVDHPNTNTLHMNDRYFPLNIKMSSVGLELANEIQAI